MLHSFRAMGLALLLAATACQQKPATPALLADAPAPAATTPTTATPAAAVPLLAAAPDTTLGQKIDNPHPDDVYVVAYRPGGGTGERYFFYRVIRTTPATVELLPARQESVDPAADVSAAGFFTDKALTYTRAEVRELLLEQPGDVQQTRLIRVRREK